MILPASMSFAHRNALKPECACTCFCNRRILASDYLRVVCESLVQQSIVQTGISKYDPAPVQRRLERDVVKVPDDGYQ